MFPRLILASEIRRPTFAAESHPPLRAIHQQPHSHAILSVGIEAANLNLYSCSVGILHDGKLRIRSLLIGIKNIIATDAVDLLRMLVLLKRPTSHIGIVRSVVSCLPIPGLPKPVPVVVESILIKRTPWGWPAPQVIMNAGRNSAIRLASQTFARSKHDTF